MKHFHGNNKAPICSVETNKNNVAITINCDEEINNIESILEVLNKHKTCITFFITEDLIEKNPEIVKKIYEKNNEIECLINVAKNSNLKGVEGINQDIKLCSDRIKNLTGFKTTLYRLNNWEYNSNVVQASEYENKYAIKWSINLDSYKDLDESEKWERLNSKIKNGDIIVFQNTTKQIAEDLDKLLTNIENKKIKNIPVSQLIYQENFVIDSNGVQKQK